MQAEFFFSFLCVFKVLLLNISKTYSDSDSWETNLECHLSNETNIMHIIQMAQERMHFTLGMPFLAVLGKFYRNVKGLSS